MKRVFTWLNNSLEEFLMGAGLIMVGRDHKIYFYLGRIFEHQLLYEKMYFYKSGAVCGDVSETRKSVD